MKNKESKVNSNKKLNVVFLLDRSGSMRTSIEDTIGGYNNYLEKQKNSNALITTILFDDYVQTLHYRKDVNEVEELTAKDYYVRGCTALYDAIGSTIKRLETDVKKEKVLFIITTDGLENASREFDKKKVSELIKKHKSWEFIYLGANIDSYAEAASIGINTKNTSNFKKSKEGILNVFESVSYLSNCMIKDRSFDDSWKQSLEKE